MCRKDEGRPGEGAQTGGGISRRDEAISYPAVMRLDRKGEGWRGKIEELLPIELLACGVHCRDFLPAPALLGDTLPVHQFDNSLTAVHTSANSRLGTSTLSGGRGGRRCSAPM